MPPRWGFPALGRVGSILDTQLCIPVSDAAGRAGYSTLECVAVSESAIEEPAHALPKCVEADGGGVRHSAGMKHLILPALLLAVALGPLVSAQKPGPPGLSLERKDHLLTIRGPGIPAEGIGVNYLEAYCRAGSTEADWVKHTVIPHTSKDTKVTPGEVRIHDVLADGGGSRDHRGGG